MKKLLKFKRVLQLSTLILTVGLVLSSVGCWLDIFGGVGEEPDKPTNTTVIYDDKEISQNGVINVGELLTTETKRITITIRNTGTDLLTIDTANITITGTNAAAFTKLTNPSESIPAGLYTSFMIDCQPIIAGENNATLTIPTSDRSRNPIRVILWMTSPYVYAVTFDGNGATSGTVPAAQTTPIGSSMTLPAPSLSRIGYTFDGWNTNADGNGTNYSAGASYTPTSNIILYAKWNGNPYTITFDDNGGTGGPLSVTAIYGSLVPAISQKPTNPGIYFAGYYDALTGGNKYYTSNLTPARNWDKAMNETLYARWSLVLEVTIIFHSNDGTNKIETQDVQEYTSTPLRLNDFTRTGYDFIGWAASPGGVVAYTDGANYMVADMDVNLYAVWAPKVERTITFYSNDENNQTRIQTVWENTPTPLSANIFTRAGYTFNGWSTTPTGSVVYGDGASYTIGTADVILYAVWSGNPYTITFNANGGSGGPSPVTAIYGNPMPVITPAPTHTNVDYDFAGYFDATTGGTMYYTASLTSARNWDKTSNTTLYAQWIQPLIEMVWIPAGTFQMGSPTSEPDRGSNETQHQVTLTTGFSMGKYQVTQEQYVAVMGTNPSYFHGGSGREPAAGEIQSRRSVELVSWYDALVFCNKLSMIEGLSPTYRINGSTDPSYWGAVPTSNNATWNAVEVVSGSTGYRLPTEAQWEYACRAGTGTAYNTGATISDNTGWYGANSNSRTHEVGKKSVNAWGLYDMHGNVHEWCWDWYNSTYYTSSPSSDPMGPGPVSGFGRVIRGGSWYNGASNLRSAFRNYENPHGRSLYAGFRVVRP